MTNNSSDTECSKQCAAFRNAQRVQGINPPVGHVDGCPRLTPKRTMGQCHGVDRGCFYGASHTADCPALYPLQRQPGDEKDALTRLVAEIRKGYLTDGSDGGEEGWETRCLDLISEAREDLKRACDEEDRLRSDAVSLRRDLTKVKADLLATQKRMGEVRQQAMQEARKELAEEILAAES